MTDISKQLGLRVIPVVKYTKTVNQELGIGVNKDGIVKVSEPTEFNFLGIGEGKQKAKKTYGKMGQPNATLIQDARNRILAEFPFEKSKAASSAQIATMISKADQEMDLALSQMGESRKSIGKFIGSDFKGNGSCGDNIECVNKAFANYQQWEKRRAELVKDQIDAESREEKSGGGLNVPTGNSGNSGIAGPGAGNSGAVSNIKNNWIWWALGGVAVITTGIFLYKKAKN